MEVLFLFFVRAFLTVPDRLADFPHLFSFAFEQNPQNAWRSAAEHPKATAFFTARFDEIRLEKGVK